MRLECEAEVTPSGPDGELVSMSLAASFGFIITLGRESLSCAVQPTTLLAGRPNRVRLRVLVSEAAQDLVHVGAAFKFLDTAGASGTGRVLEVARV